LRRIKLILAALTAMTTIVVLSAAAVAQPYDYTYGTGSDYCYGGCGSFSSPPSDMDADDNPPLMQTFDEDDSFGNNCGWVQDSDGDWFQECD
jgi:hypothetical protein